ncbi:MAG: hypothetical protein WCB74_25480, partial [Pseudolabrys sp.]
PEDLVPSFRPGWVQDKSRHGRHRRLRRLRAAEGIAKVVPPATLTEVSPWSFVFSIPRMN